MGGVIFEQWRGVTNSRGDWVAGKIGRVRSLTFRYSQLPELQTTGGNTMLEKSDIILKNPSPFSIESLLGKKNEVDGPCVSVSPPALQSPFIFPQLLPPGQLPSQSQMRATPDVFLPQNFPFDLLARGLYQNMTGLIGNCSVLIL